jgi:hypothetical protein
MREAGRGNGKDDDGDAEDYKEVHLPERPEGSVHMWARAGSDSPSELSGARASASSTPTQWSPLAVERRQMSRLSPGCCQAC